MITFACKTVDIKDIIRCSFDLSKTEYALFEALLQLDDSLTVAQLSKRLSLDRSTVQKGISRLQEKELVARRQVNLSGGGYRFIYGIEDKESLRMRLEGIVEQWYANVRKSLQQW